MTGQGAHRQSVGDRIARVGESPGVLICAGVVSVLIGLLVLAWPSATIKVVAFLFAIQLLVAGVLQLVSACSADRGAGGRVLFVLLGALSILVGLLCLREPLQTALVLGLLIGALWVVQGITGVVEAIGNERGRARGWMIASGVLSVIGGAVVLVYPGASLAVLVWMLGIFLVLNGVVVVVQGVVAGRLAAPASAPAGRRARSTPSPS